MRNTLMLTLASLVMLSGCESPPAPFTLDGPNQVMFKVPGMS